MFDRAKSDGIVPKHPALVLFTPGECKRLKVDPKLVADQLGHTTIPDLRYRRAAINQLENAGRIGNSTAPSGIAPA